MRRVGPFWDFDAVALVGSLRLRMHESLLFLFVSFFGSFASIISSRSLSRCNKMGFLSFAHDLLCSRN